jgi:hypothetical protein
MAYTDPLADMFSTSVGHAEWLGMSTDGYANPTYSTSVATVAARVVTEQRLVRNFDGQEQLATTTVWVLSTSTYSASDQFTVDGDTPVLLSIETYRDENGITHSKLGFG